MSSFKTVINGILFVVGLIFVCFALVVSNAIYSQILLGENGKDLSWGPLLFRIMLMFHGILLIAVGLTQLKAGIDKTSIRLFLKRTDSRFEGSTFLALLGLSLAAITLRLWGLNTDLWVDEVFTLLDFVRLPVGQLLTSFPSQNQHMLYSILAYISTAIFGESAWALRLPSVLFGVASIWALFFLINKLLGKREALLGCALMTVSYHHIWFSQNARGYMGLLFFTLLATWLWFEALEKETWHWWIGYSAAVIFGMWIHMTMAFVVAAHGLVYLAFLFFPKLSGNQNRGFSFERNAGIKPIIAWILSVTVTLQLYALALPEFLSVGLHEESKNSEWTNPLWVLTETLQNLSIGFAGIAVVICGIVFVAFGWLKLFEKNRRASFLMILPPIFAGTFMLMLGHNLFPRFFFFAMGFGLLIVIYGAVELPKFVFEIIGSYRFRRNTIVNAGVGFASSMILASLITVPRNYSLPKQNFSGAREFVENNRLPEETVVAVSIAGLMYGNYFAPQWSVAKTGAELKKIESQNLKVMLIYTLSPEIKAFHPDIWGMIEKDYEVLKVFPGTLNGGEIFVCQKRNTSEENNESSRNFNQSENDSVWKTANGK
jgi:mannosyltransferase